MKKILKSFFEKDNISQLAEIKNKDEGYKFILKNKKEIIKDLKNFGKENKLDVKGALRNLRKITRQNREQSDKFFYNLKEKRF